MASDPSDSDPISVAGWRLHRSGHYILTIKYIRPWAYSYFQIDRPLAEKITGSGLGRTDADLKFHVLRRDWRCGRRRLHGGSHSHHEIFRSASSPLRVRFMQFFREGPIDLKVAVLKTSSCAELRVLSAFALAFRNWCRPAHRSAGE